MEIWKDIIDFEGFYQVSSFGNVRSLDRIISNQLIGEHKRNGRILKLEINKNCRYFYIDLCKNNIHKKFRVSRLVALSFILNPEDKSDVNHIDGNKLNNNVDNLEWVTRRENIIHAYKVKKTSSKYTGVSWHKNRFTWQANIFYNGKKKFIGYFNTQEEAHFAYLNKRKEVGIISKY